MKHLSVDIHVENVRIKWFDFFELKQKVNGHHEFTLRYRSYIEARPEPMSVGLLGELVGKRFSIRFGYGEQNSQEFVGIVTNVHFDQRSDRYGRVVLNGMSSTIMLESGNSFACYANKSLKEVIDTCTKGLIYNMLKISVNATYDGRIEQLIQYNESNFNFLNRLALTYHESFYYDGNVLHFGLPNQLEDVSLNFGDDLLNLQYEMGVMPLKVARSAYNSESDEFYSFESVGTEGGASNARKQSNVLFDSSFNVPAEVGIESREMLKHFVEREQLKLSGQLLGLYGRSSNAKIKLGSKVFVNESIGVAECSLVDASSSFLVREVVHTIDAGMVYRNEFRAVDANAKAMFLPICNKPNVAMQRAKVVDNADPEGQGRVRVQFDWVGKVNEPTGWLRVMAPDAGSSEKVVANRGFVFVPEKGDQVLVGFEEGSLARPIVMGSLFHGKNGQGGGDKNQLKSLVTGSGIAIVLDDSNGSIRIEDAGGNVLRMHGDGVITIDASKKLIINTHDFVLNASNSMVFNAHKGSIDITASKDSLNLKGETNVALSSGSGPMKINAKQGIKVDAENVAIKGGASVKISSTNTEFT